MEAPTSLRTSEQSSGVGASRHCELVEGFGTLDETVIEWDEKRAISWNMSGEGGPPVTDMVGRFTLEATAGGTEVSFVVDYGLLDGVPGKAEAEIEAAFRTVVPALVAGLKRYTETGQGTTYDEMISGHAGPTAEAATLSGLSRQHPHPLMTTTYDRRTL